MSRRQALKAGALVAGTAWVVPVVEPFHLTAGAAEATSGPGTPPDPPPGSPPENPPGNPPGSPPGPPSGERGGSGGTGGIGIAKPAKGTPASGITYTG